MLLHHGTEAPFCGGLLNNKRRGLYVCRLCGLPLFRGEDQVRERHRLAELLRADRRGSRPRGARREPRHDPHRDPLRALRFAPGPRLPRRPAANRPALLHQFRLARVRRRTASPSPTRSPAAMTPTSPNGGKKLAGASALRGPSGARTPWSAFFESSGASTGSSNGAMNTETVRCQHGLDREGRLRPSARRRAHRGAGFRRACAAIRSRTAARLLDIRLLGAAEDEAGAPLDHRLGSAAGRRGHHRPAGELRLDQHVGHALEPRQQDQRVHPRQPVAHRARSGR